MHVEQTVLYGWKNSVCGRTLAPFITECPCHGHSNQTVATPQETAIPAWIFGVKTNITSSDNGMTEVKG